MNVEWFISSREGRFGRLAHTLSMLEDDKDDNTTYVNPVHSDSTVSLTT